MKDLEIIQLRRALGMIPIPSKPPEVSAFIPIEKQINRFWPKRWNVPEVYDCGHPSRNSRPYANARAIIRDYYFGYRTSTFRGWAYDFRGVS